MKIWNIENNEHDYAVSSDLMRFKVNKSGNGRISDIVWSDLNIAYFDVFIRTGHSYDLYSFNQLIDQLKVQYQKMNVQEHDKNIRISVESAARDIIIQNDIVVDNYSQEISLSLSISKYGPGEDKYQIIFDGAFPAFENNYCFILPSQNKLIHRRPYEPGGQKILDQDHMQFFPRTNILDQANFMISSGNNGKTILAEGDNLKFFSCVMAPNLEELFCCNIYGEYIKLEKGQKYQNTLKFKLKNGISDFSHNMRNASAAIDAVMERKYIKKENSVKIFFPTFNKITNTKAIISNEDNIFQKKTGKGNLELDTSKLEDGAYKVKKELTIGGDVFSSTEDLVILKNKYLKFDKEIERIHNFIEGLNNDSALTGLRKNTISFKLDEAEKYLRFTETDQAHNLLKDAERIVKAIRENEKAEMPTSKKTFYENTLQSHCYDFQYYGNGDIEFTDKMGLYIAPARTVNIWSKFTLTGSFCIEFDYHPLIGRGGTMLQICGNHPNPINEYSMMCSATGYMPHYNFGMSCYHFSFCRGQKQTGRPQICNFRKTGNGFYVLNRINDPVPCENEKWHKLTFVKKDRHFLFFVNNKLVQECFDEAHNEAFFNGGHFGIRNWAGRKSYFKNLKIFTEF